MKKDLVRELVYKETEGTWRIQHYRSWLKKPTRCSYCGHKFRKVSAIKERGHIIKVICTDCLKSAGYNVAPATMKLDDDKIAEMVAKKLKRVFAENPILQSLEYQEDFVSIVKKTCDKMKKEVQDARDKELESFSSYQDKDA